MACTAFTTGLPAPSSVELGRTHGFLWWIRIFNVYRRFVQLLTRPESGCGGPLWLGRFVWQRIGQHPDAGRLLERVLAHSRKCQLDEESRPTLLRRLDLCDPRVRAAGRKRR